LRTAFAFGLLEGWWLSTESERVWGPCLDQDGWEKFLSRTGFSENQVVLHDHNDDICHEFSIIVATAVTEPVMASSDSIPGTICLNSHALVDVLVVHDETQLDLAMKLQDYLTRADDQITVGTTVIGDISLEHYNSKDGILIFLIELQRSVWYNLSAEMFHILQKLLTATTKGLWVTKSHGCDPNLRLVDGVSRVLNAELGSTSLTCLNLQGNVQDSLLPNQMAHILQICKRLRTSDEIDTEYTEIEGILHIPRLITPKSLNKEIETRQRPEVKVQRLWSSEIPLRLTIDTPGLLNTLSFIEDTEYTQPLKPHEVEIRVASAGLNFRDILIALGRLNVSNASRLGNELAGIVTRLGSACRDSDLKVGDSVAGGCYDTFRTFARCDWRNVAKIPEGISFSTAAALQVNHVTSWLCLHERAHLQPGETVLIHSAAGGTGQAALQLAQYIGATVIVTVGTESKREMIMKRYGIPFTHIFSSRDTSFTLGVKRLTCGRGVDVVFNSLSGDMLVASWECIAAFGRFIEIGKKDILARNHLPMEPFDRNVSFSAFDLSDICRERPDKARKALVEVLALVAKGVMSPAEPLQVYSVSDLEKAIRHLQSGKTMGKIVVDLRPDDQVVVRNPCFRLLLRWFLEIITDICAGENSHQAKFLILSDGNVHNLRRTRRSRT